LDLALRIAADQKIEKYTNNKMQARRLANTDAFDLNIPNAILKGIAIAPLHRNS
jgi:hypothetical protein